MLLLFRFWYKPPPNDCYTHAENRFGSVLCAGEKLDLFAFPSVSSVIQLECVFPDTIFHRLHTNTFLSQVRGHLPVRGAKNSGGMTLSIYRASSRSFLRSGINDSQGRRSGMKGWKKNPPMCAADCQKYRPESRFWHVGKRTPTVECSYGRVWTTFSAQRLAASGKRAPAYELHRFHNTHTHATRLLIMTHTRVHTHRSGACVCKRKQHFDGH